jgi:hypothetical protein
MRIATIMEYLTCLWKICMERASLKCGFSIILIVAMTACGLAQQGTNPDGQPRNIKHSSTARQKSDINAMLGACNVSWDVPGPGSAESMPIGNGDIGLNVWVETNGELAFYISKTDAWGGEVKPAWDRWMNQGGVLMLSRSILK